MHLKCSPDEFVARMDIDKAGRVHHANLHMSTCADEMNVPMKLYMVYTPPLG